MEREAGVINFQSAFPGAPEKAADNQKNRKIHTSYYTKNRASPQGFPAFFIYNVWCFFGRNCGEKKFTLQDIGNNSKKEKNYEKSEKI